MFSNLLQENITLKISLPDEYKETQVSTYTSIYLLDANYFFDDAPGLLDDYLVRGPGMCNIVHQLTSEGKIPCSVLIGIGYTEEQRDQFTRTRPEQFLKFFKEELIPLVESKFSVGKSAMDRVLFGYSSSAHFSTFALMDNVYHGNQTFSKYISISGVYYEELEAYKLEEKINQQRASSSFSGKSLYMAIGSVDDKTRLVEHHSTFINKLQYRNYKNFNWVSEIYEGKGHYDIPEVAFAKGLTWLFSHEK
ncbi:MAG: hypothetical protein JEZ00_15640 [Anaerolineaceae bacterium]|nr:hypothetical protein [Anaerolineaceae bacterium]